MNELSLFIQAAAHPDECAARIQNQGKKIIGYLCSYTPEEIIHAAGAHPVRLFGTGETILNADRHLQSYCCSLARGVLENAVSGRLDFLDGAVFPHTCDTIQRLSDIWRLNTDFGFFADVVLPVKFDTESARDYLREVLEKFKEELERWLNITITDQSLGRSFEIYNTIRKKLTELYELKSENPELISGRDLAAVVKGTMIMERDSLPDHLGRLIAEIKSGLYTRSDTGKKKRLILSGSICDHPDFYELLEKSGGIVVGDDLCTGERFFEGEIEQTGSPMKAISRRYAERTICPAKHVSERARGEALIKKVKDRNAQGVIFLFVKFCDPHAFDYPYIKEMLEKESIPGIMIEVEDQLPPEGQLKTRFETFIHML
ncbi:MAG: 2-hydroxyacyl-CoA dehydratase family protein [Syntrophales bacterium]|jgi:bcr-type benzoyl-CoA reductase subunit C|nr:2-hydroxyacyl-CoA dehydratase family protein [Syntrophales bacterium]MDY0043233.1 2-hydroxyacyl-CoA dehydratase family protein [Syntrophales bacterium]